MQVLLAIVAVAAIAAATSMALLQVRTNRRLREQLLAARARAERADAAAEVLVAAETRAGALQQAVEALPLGVIITAPGGRELLRNHAAAELAGTRPADALASGAAAEVMALAAAGQAGTRALELHGPPPRTLSLAGIPIEGGGAAVTVEDVTDRRRLDVVRRDFVANVSHELKTPVAALGLLAEALAAEEDLGVVRRLVDRMQDEAFRVNRVIDDLLDLSRLEGEPTVRHDRVPVHAIVREAVEQVRPAADSRDIRIAVQDAPPPWSVMGQQRQLVSALVNLIDNAVKYSADGAVVSLRVRSDGVTIALEVEDQGVGIPSRELDRIFERFYRVDRGRGRGTGGTGLGLSIVRHVAANHGGDVRVTSVEGEGSVFTLLLPAEPGPIGLMTSEAG